MPSTDFRPVDGRRSPSIDPPATADLFVRNYDVERTYRVQLKATGDDGTYEEHYRLLPGQVVAEFGVLPTGPCRVAVAIRGAGTRRDECALDPEDVALVEVGNGVVTATERTY